MTKPPLENAGISAIRPAAVPKLHYRTGRAVTALIIREMATTYGRSPGGYFWAVAQPVALIVVLSLAFSMLLRSPPLGTDFILFYATGLMPLRMFQTLSINVGGALQFSKPLLGYPRVTFVDAILGRAILTALTQFTVSLIIFTAVNLWTHSSAINTYEIIIESYALAIVLGIGIGTFNCFLFTLMPVWRLIWGIATGPIILISAVLYLYEDTPLFAQEYLWFNPLVHIIGLSRMGFYSTYSPSYISIPFVLACGLIPAFFGVLLLRKYGRSILYL
ncbi:sugar ABC transporter permease (plasmid) [Pseudorhodobacter turbinis]|uniref:Sugar ABC transporter permease n=1 Tax=Pseudorhodobacter turbinis TaxID=2500533 RepID=A0A4P8EMN6_9RHOB|nr:ABC transporter permease [Pseudorhodobacter turbinis]QCO58162.1 sugar ABC transporter permease [Pseudorhodobacter turbinis]